MATNEPYDRVWDWEKHPTAPLRWKKPGIARLKGDPFEAVPLEFLDRLFAVFALRPDVVFQVLTKRPERMREYLSDMGRHYMAEVDGEYMERWGDAAVELTGDPCSAGAPIEDCGWPLPNVWLGTSVENQRWADIRIPELLATPAAVRFISAEPLLGPLDLRPWRLRLTCCGMDDGSVTRQAWAEANELRESYIAVEGHERAAILDRSPDWGLQRRPDWVIVGGESGPGARPCDVAWARSVVAQCKAAGVACFVKQLGSRPVSLMEQDDDFPRRSWAQNQSLALKSRKGGDMAEWPEDLRVREMPR